jgi:hypothetical protein
VPAVHAARLCCSTSSTAHDAMFTFTPLSLARLHVTRICDLHADNHSVMVSADVALKASMYFWMMMFIGYVAATHPFFLRLLNRPNRARPP